MTNEEMIENLKCVIADISAQCERLKAENAELKSSLTHANEECLKWHERAQNLLKDSGGSISGYEKKISDLQSENAALRERLEKAVVNKCIYYINSVWNDATMTRKDEVCQGAIDYACDNFVEVAGLVLKWEKIYFTREAAEARLAELKGEK